jgi:hypothetical protein
MARKLPVCGTLFAYSPPAPNIFYVDYEQLLLLRLKGLNCEVFWF